MNQLGIYSVKLYAFEIIYSLQPNCIKLLMYIICKYMPEKS